MASPKLTSEQRSQLLNWLAADYDYSVISKWMEDLGWPKLSRAAITYYRRTRDEGVKRLRDERYLRALTTGLATKEERVERLKRHADKLELIKWEPDKNGRLWNEKAWRETLADIAAEMGHRKLPIEFDIGEVLAKRAIELGIDIKSDPVLSALFTAVGAEITGTQADGATGGAAPGGESIQAAGLAD